MDVVRAVGYVGYLIISFFSGVGFATYFIVRSLSKQMHQRVTEAEADIDLMYALHKMEPPSVGREAMRDGIKKLK